MNTESCLDVTIWPRPRRRHIVFVCDECLAQNKADQLMGRRISSSEPALAQCVHPEVSWPIMPDKQRPETDIFLVKESTGTSLDILRSDAAIFLEQLAKVAWHVLMTRAENI